MSGEIIKRTDGTFTGRSERPLTKPCKAVLKGGIPCWGPARANGWCWSHRKEEEKDVMEIQAGDTVVHGPTGEDWFILGVNSHDGLVCVGGWPATIGKLSDCTLITKAKRPLTAAELEHRHQAFGSGWDDAVAEKEAERG